MKFQLIKRDVQYSMGGLMLNMNGIHLLKKFIHVVNAKKYHEYLVAMVGVGEAELRPSKNSIWYIFGL